MKRFILISFALLLAWPAMAQVTGSGGGTSTSGISGNGTNGYFYVAGPNGIASPTIVGTGSNGVVTASGFLNTTLSPRTAVVTDQNGNQVSGSFGSGISLSSGNVISVPNAPGGGINLGDALTWTGTGWARLGYGLFQSSIITTNNSVSNILTFALSTNYTATINGTWTAGGYTNKNSLSVEMITTVRSDAGVLSIATNVVLRAPTNGWVTNWQAIVTTNGSSSNILIQAQSAGTEVVNWLWTGNIIVSSNSLVPGGSAGGGPFALWASNTIVTITNTGYSTNLANYPVKLTVGYSNGMDVFFKDIRFADSNNNSLAYWIVPDSVDRGNQATMWVNVPNIGASTNTQITMYWSNSAAGDITSGSNTFAPYGFFDDFGTNVASGGGVGSNYVWQRMANMLHPAQQHNMESINGVLYNFGDEQTFTNYASAYVPSSDSWTNCANMPSVGSSLHVRAINGKIYVQWGQIASAANTNLTAVFNQSNNTWTLLTASTFNLEDGQSGSISNRYLFRSGGVQATNGVDWTSQVLDIYDTVGDTHTYITNMPVGEALGDTGFMDSTGTNYYICSGNTNMNNPNYPNLTNTPFVYKYSAPGSTWSQIANEIFYAKYREIDYDTNNDTAYSWCGAAWHTTAGRAFIGGQGYKVGAGTWSRKALFPVKSYDTLNLGGYVGTAQGKIGQYIYVSGGYFMVTGVATVTNAMWRYDTVMDNSNSPNAALWTLTTKGTAGSYGELREGNWHAVPTASADSSVNLVSASAMTFTNSFAMESRVQYVMGTNDSMYVNQGFGSGSLVDNANGSSTWFQTYLNSGYSAYMGSTNSNGASLRKMPAAGSVSVLGSAFAANGGDVNPSGGLRYPETQLQGIYWDNHTITYDQNGVLTWYTNGNQVATATDTTFKDNQKKIFLSSGNHTTYPTPNEVRWEWVFVRQRVTPEPTVHIGP